MTLFVCGTASGVAIRGTPVAQQPTHCVTSTVFSFVSRFAIFYIFDSFFLQRHTSCMQQRANFARTPALVYASRQRHYQQYRRHRHCCIAILCACSVRVYLFFGFILCTVFVCVCVCGWYAGFAGRSDNDNNRFRTFVYTYIGIYACALHVVYMYDERI